MCKESCEMVTQCATKGSRKKERTLPNSQNIFRENNKEPTERFSKNPFSTTANQDAEQNKFAKK